MRVLLVEDEPKMARLLRRGLREEGVHADVEECGVDAVWAAQEFSYDALVLDVMLPDIDGVEVCRRLRANENWVPVLMLTARDGVGDRVRGLDAGADDYLVKPFSFEELLARLRAVARRTSVARPAVLRAGDLLLDPALRRAWRGEQELSLTTLELSLLELLLRRQGQVLSRTVLLHHVWDLDYEQHSNVVEVCVKG